MAKKTNHNGLHMTCPSCAGDGVVLDERKFGPHLRELRESFTACRDCGHHSRKRFTACPECGSENVGHLSMKALGDKVGVSDQYICSIEKARHPLHHETIKDTIKRIEEVLK